MALWAKIRKLLGIASSGVQPSSQQRRTVPPASPFPGVSSNQRQDAVAKSETSMLRGCRIVRAKSEPRLRADLDCDVLDLEGNLQITSIPEGIKAGRINATGCRDLAALPASLDTYEMSLSGTAVEVVPSGVRVKYRLDLTDCSRLRQLPAGLHVGSLILRNCTALTHLPPGLHVNSLDLRGCTALSELPDDLRVEHGRLDLRDCRQVSRLPAGIGPLAQLNIANCSRLGELPPNLVVNSWIDIGGSAILREQDLPMGCWGAELRWRGVPVDRRLAFHPESVTGQEVLAEPNAELRRVKLERIGLERFVAEVQPEILDEDRDAGGQRRLLKIKMNGDEDLVCVAVSCPSTQRKYLIRVPPTTQTCHQAVAWTAGFDNPKDYRPTVET